MTNEEAIEYNKNLREYMRITDEKSEYKFLQENYEALNMAIKALGQQTCDGMRDATEEERKSTKAYIDSISKPTGLQFDDIYEELDFVQPHKKLSVKLQLCEDCISRAALLEELGEEPFNWNDSPEEFQEVRDYQWFRSLVENAPPVTPKQTMWIPCSERLPEKHGCYETTVKIDIPDLKPYYEIRVAQFDGKDFDIGYIGDGFSVIAWKLPSEPYREEQDVKTIQIMIDKRGCVTNGDVIKNMFPNIIYEEGYVFIESDTHTKVIMTVQEDWWNAPYKTESEVQ